MIFNLPLLGCHGSNMYARICLLYIRKSVCTMHLTGEEYYSMCLCEYFAEMKKESLLYLGQDQIEAIVYLFLVF